METLLSGTLPLACRDKRSRFRRIGSGAYRTADTRRTPTANGTRPSDQVHTFTAHHHERFALAVVSAYGLIAVVALTLAWRRTFHPLLPYAYATFDVALVCFSLLLVSRMLDFPPHMVFAIPASAIIFVVLAHAAMRFRPGLVVYAGALTTAVMPAPEAASPFLSGTQHGDLLQSLLHSRFMPFAIIALATLALWATSHRTYEMLQRSIDYSRRLGTLSRFFSPRLADRLARERSSQLSSGRRQRCTIMFIDICKFTEIARNMAPEDQQAAGGLSGSCHGNNLRAQRHGGQIYRRCRPGGVRGH